MVDLGLQDKRRPFFAVAVLFALVSLFSNVTSAAVAQSSFADFQQATEVARQSLMQKDLAAAEQKWKKAWGLIQTAGPSDPRFYYTLHWLAQTLMLENKPSEVQPVLQPYCTQSCLESAEPTDDVRATVYLYSECLRQQGKKDAADQALITLNRLWSRETNKFVPEAVEYANSTANSTATTTSTPAATAAAPGSKANSAGPENTSAVEAGQIFVPPPPVLPTARNGAAR